MCTASPNLLWRHLQSHRKGKGKWGFIEFLASMADSRQYSRIAALVLGDQAYISGLMNAEKVWYLLENRFVCRAIACMREVTDVRYTACLQPTWSAQDVCMCPGLTHQKAKANINNLKILPAAEIIKAVEVHFGTKVLQSYKCLQLSWTNNLVFGKAWVHFSA